VPTGAASNGDRAPTVRSAACISAPPGITDGGDTEWFIPLPGRGQRRSVQVGEHLPVDHALVLSYPSCFVDSAEPVDAWPVGLATIEARKRQQAERLRLASHPCRRVTPACARCGQESEHSVITFDQPAELDRNSELAGLDDHDFAGRIQVENRYAAMARVWQEQQVELLRVEAAWRAEHQQCPEGTPPLPQPQVPENPPLHWRLSTVRTLG
jgi:hypothetical protein